MLWTVIVLLVALWVIGMLTGVAGAFVHLLLVAALVVLLVNPFGRRTARL